MTTTRERIQTNNMLEDEDKSGVDKEVSTRIIRNGRNLRSTSNTELLFCQNSFDALTEEGEMENNLEEDNGSVTGFSRVLETPNEVVGQMTDLGGPINTQRRGRSQESIKQKYKQVGPRGGSLGFNHSLVLSKRIEWQAYRRSTIRNKTDKAQHKEVKARDKSKGRTPNNSQMRKPGGMEMENTDQVVSVMTEEKE
ncbi:hypothetical protein FRX31_028930 [Thalictrum thalictroides]|uniref:Uncharacterized protein n=1 Tax=Thalictrum thalictroides TaxID=46969 RepID=A0A7J6V950_THATH|nr:hypothetical protein FRX31_028930 [Thalictrum thalictroides]